MFHSAKFILIAADVFVTIWHQFIKNFILTWLVIWIISSNIYVLETYTNLFKGSQYCSNLLVFLLWRTSILTAVMLYGHRWNLNTAQMHHVVIDLKHNVDFYTHNLPFTCPDQTYGWHVEHGSSAEKCPFHDIQACHNATGLHCSPVWYSVWLQRTTNGPFY